MAHTRSASALAEAWRARATAALKSAASVRIRVTVAARRACPFATAANLHLSMAASTALLRATRLASGEAATVDSASAPAFRVHRQARSVRDKRWARAASQDESSRLPTCAVTAAAARDVSATAESACDTPTRRWGGGGGKKNGGAR